ncbi:Lipoate-protein ligase A associated domain [Halapricum desulfuricans]|uniref:Lipoate-protein ligase A associated domain n=1 Tax=Halapricum desulfuricans TaxID=2841257 RepID=A0A897N0R0_9EURY|nr:Lipoate-protein ligase A associated domain [Halapricum desulfuricans]QSG12925.1 Lipoate-protein ligase A associated domain [Halapricum desulfuricans]
MPDGKLVEVAVSGTDRIESARITGDFFLEPPEARAELEAAIEGHSFEVDRETLVASIESVDARLIGFDHDHLAEATLEAIE